MDSPCMDCLMYSMCKPKDLLAMYDLCPAFRGWLNKDGLIKAGHALIKLDNKTTVIDTSMYWRY